MTKYLMLLAATMLVLACDNGDSQSPMDNQPAHDDTMVTDDVADSEQPDEIADTDTTTENTVVADDAEPDGKPDLDVPATCGNGVIDLGEICDGGSVYCGDLDEKWAFGTAYCNDTCSGYNTYECQEPYADDNDITDPEEDEVTDDQSEDDPVLPDSDEQIDEDLVDIQPDPDMVDEDTYDDWVPDTIDTPPMDNDTAEENPDTDDVSDEFMADDVVIVADDALFSDDDVVATMDVLCTGQTQCFNGTMAAITCPAEGTDFYGQDAQYAVLNGYCMSRDYTVSGNADSDIVSDNNTGLHWQRTLSTSTFTWNDAVAYCDNLTYGGQIDWRLPTRKELATLPDYGRNKPAIDTTIFPGTQKGNYWSSSSYVALYPGAWYVSFSSGMVTDSYGNKTNTYYARCVRGAALPDSAFTESTVSGKVIVTDTVTGLIWTKDYSGEDSWKNALKYCETLDYGDATDWRLPNIEELKSLIDTTTDQPASNFPEMPSEFFWSSSTNVGYATDAWGVSFTNGSMETESQPSHSKAIIAVARRKVQRKQVSFSPS